MSATDPLLEARARVLHDLGARGLDVPSFVDVVDDAVAARRWWVEQWADGSDYVAGLVAQDVQDRLLDDGMGRWPACTACDDLAPHELRVEPELGRDPQWVCDKAGKSVAPLGSLA